MEFLRGDVRGGFQAIRDALFCQARQTLSVFVIDVQYGHIRRARTCPRKQPSLGGKVVIEDRLVTLTDVSGQVANGKLFTNATLDFRHPVFEHHFAIMAQKLDLHLLPMKWKIPRSLGGRLSGTANLAVKIGDGKPQTSGDGTGVIDQPRLAMVPLKGPPIRIHLLADADGFHFLPVLPE